jgi:hypothetical protein
VGQRRQELVLPPVLLPQGVVELGVLDGDCGAVRQVLGQGEVGSVYRRPDSAVANVRAPNVWPETISGTQM